MAPKKKKKDDAGEEEDPLQALQELYLAKTEEWMLDKKKLEQSLELA